MTRNLEMLFGKFQKAFLSNQTMSQSKIELLAKRTFCKKNYRNLRNVQKLFVSFYPTVNLNFIYLTSNGGSKDKINNLIAFQ